jgi:divalent metal cation (Fe/Co/Zn/Cd) transporter
VNADHGLRGLKPCLGIAALLTALKLAAYLGTGALVLLMEALHSLADVVVAALLFIAARRSAENPPRMWGYGSPVNLAGLVAAILVTAAPVVLVLEGAIPRLLDPAEYRNLPLTAAAVLLSMVLTAAPVGGLLVQRPRGHVGDIRLVELLSAFWSPWPLSCSCGPGIPRPTL